MRDSQSLEVWEELNAAEANMATKLNGLVVACSCIKCGFRWELHFPYGLPNKVEEGKSRRLYTRCPNGCRVSD